MTTKKGIIYGYLRLQGLRIRRKIVEWGLPFPIGLGIFVVGFVAFSLYIMAKSTWGPTLYALLALSGVTTFSETRRRDFLKSVFSAADYRLVRLLENALLVIPFVVMLSIKGDTWIALALLGAAMASVFWPMKGWNLRALPTPFSKKPFEYAVGFRKTWPLLLAAYLIAGMALRVDNYELGLFAGLLIYLITLSYHYYPEHEYYVWIYRHSPRRFLWMKTSRAVLYSTALCMPVIFALLLFYPDRFLEAFLTILVGCAYLVFLILGKYSAYPHEMPIPAAIFFTAGILFPPILVLLIPFFYRKAVRQLHTIL